MKEEIKVELNLLPHYIAFALPRITPAVISACLDRDMLGDFSATLVAKFGKTRECANACEGASVVQIVHALSNLSKQGRDWLACNLSDHLYS